jgi:PAS domain S-box-containing protein
LRRPGFALLKEEKLLVPTAAIPQSAAPDRLRALRAIGLLGSPPQKEFEGLTRLAVLVVRAPTSLLSLLDGERQFFLSAHGLPEKWAGRREIPLSHCICRHVVSSDAPVAIADSRIDALAAGNPGIVEAKLGSYLGYPIHGPDGHAIGALCVIDALPREWSQTDKSLLAELAGMASDALALRLASDKRGRVAVAPDDLAERIEEGFYALDESWRITAVNGIAAQFWGKPAEALIGRSIFEIVPGFAGSPAHAAHQRAVSSGLPSRVEALLAGPGQPLSLRIFPDPSGLSVLIQPASDLRSTREALRERNEVLALAEQSAGIGIWDSDPATGLVRGTPQFFRLVGLEPSERPVPIEAIRAIRHPEDQQRVFEGFQNAVASGAETYDSEYRIIRRTDGKTRWIFGRGRILRDGTGKPIRYSGIDIDITERKQAEAALRESEERFRSLVQGVRDYAIFMLDAEGRVATWNEGAALILGYAAEEILGQPISVFYPAEKAAQGWPALEITRARTGGRSEDEGWRLRKGGSRFWASVVISALRDEAGRLKGFAAITRDLTVAREAEEALRRSEERLRLCQDAAEIGVWDWDIASGAIEWSERNFILHGIPVQQSGPRYEQWQAAIHPLDRDRVNAAITQAIAIGAPYQADYRVLHGHGEVRWLAVRGRVLTDEAGRPVRMLGVNLDITDRRAAAEALARMNDELEQRVAERTAALEQEALRRAEAETRLRQSQKMEALGQLTGGVAHDFNNLLTIILGSLDTIQRRTAERPADAGGKQLIEGISRPIGMAVQATQSAAQLTHRLLAFSRQQPLQPKVLKINDLIAGMTELIGRTLSEAVTVEASLAPDLWPCFADANQLEIALLNLVVNARDAMPEGGRLGIETGNVCFSEADAAERDLGPGDYVMLAVSDTGTGMGREVMERAFEPFFTTKGPGKGSGLGLSMVYGFVKQSGGHIRLHSGAGLGTTVTIYLPRSSAAAEEPAEAPRAVSREIPRAKPGETILVVEDNAGVRGYSVSTLLELGYLVREAASGAEALRLLEHEPDLRIDLLFTDVVLPDGMNGRQLAQRMLKLRPHLPVLFTTGYTRDAIVKHGRLDPEVDLIPKPFGIDQLARKIRQLLDER